jgi:hypothetical protein
LGKHGGEPASDGSARWKHVGLHCFRLEEGHSYRETPNRLKYMTEICDALGLDPYDLPEFTTIYKAFHNWLTKYEFYALGVEPLILQRGSKPLTLGHNALIRAKGYSQRWMAETSYSTTKRSLGDAVRALGWYRQFREIVLIFAIINIEPLCETL